MATNDFLPFGIGAGANVLDQSSYSSLPARSSGFQSGTASSAQFNKALRQSTAMAYVLGQFIKVEGALDALDNGDLDAVVANFVASLDKRQAGNSIGAFLTVTGGPSNTPPGGPAAGDEYLVGESPSGLFSSQARKVARWNGSAWVFSSARIGRLARIGGTEAYFQLHATTGWTSYAFGATAQAPTAWGGITGTLGNQGDLSTALAGKSDVGHNHDGAYVKLNPAGGASQTVGGPLVTGALSAPSATINPTSGNASLFLDSLASGGERPAVILRKQGATRGTISAEGSGSGAVFHETFGSSPCHQFFTNQNGGGSVQRVSINSDGSLSVNGSTGTSQKVLAGGVAAWASLADLQPQMQYDHVIAQGVTWTIGTTNAWVKMPLNTLVANNIPGASASSSVVTLPAGTYEVLGRVNQSVGAGTRWHGRVRNTTSGVTIAVTMLGGASGYEPITEHTAVGRFTLGTVANIELQCWAENATNGATQNLASGEAIIMNSLTITKIG